MFDKLKQLKQLKDLQDTIKRENYTAEVNGIKITVNGAFEVQDVEVNSQLEKSELEKAIKQAFSRAISDAQSSAAKKLSGLMGG